MTTMLLLMFLEKETGMKIRKETDIKSRKAEENGREGWQSHLYEYRLSGGGGLLIFVPGA
jgi:hypothetical protein